jgi:3-oxoacyl-[acyl-carrier-protein] synthase-3
VKVLSLAGLSRGVRLRSVASYLPSRVVTNDDLVALGAALTADEIVRLSGILERHWVADDEATSDLATKACRLALSRADVLPGDVSRLIVATVSPDHASPSAACFVQGALALGQAPAFDLTASCSGFLYALDSAVRAVLTGDDHVLACAADVRSRFLDLSDRATCALFGDGAGAAVVSSCPPGEGILGIGLLADGAGVHSVYVPAGGSRKPASHATVEAREHAIHMSEGPQVYLAAVEGMAETSERLLAALGLSWSDVDLLVPHQPNRRILERLTRILRIPSEKMFVNVDHIGNVSGATCAIALDEALRTRELPEGARVMLLAAGAGYTAGAALIRIDGDLVSRTRRA